MRPVAASRPSTMKEMSCHSYQFCLRPSSPLTCQCLRGFRIPVWAHLLNCEHACTSGAGAVAAASRDVRCHAALSTTAAQGAVVLAATHRGSPQSHPQRRSRYASDDTASYSSTAQTTMGGKRPVLRLGVAHWRRRVQRSSLAQALTEGRGAAVQAGGRLWPTEATRQ